MNHYLVTAKPKSGRLKILLNHLRGQACASNRSFGQERRFSLQNARLLQDGRATWEEQHNGSPPPAEKRGAALEEFFEEMKSKPVREGKGWEKIQELPPLFPELALSPSPEP